jgi:hypothetical protein
MSGSDREFEGDRRREAGHWLAVVLADIRVARLCLEADAPALGIAAYHCQQAAEKLVKGMLVMADIPFGKTHDMERLGELAASRYPQWRHLLAATGPLTVWGYAYRYPVLEAAAEPPPPVLRQALDVIEQVAARLRTLGVSEAGT